MDKTIISTQNPKIKEVVKLRKTAQRKKNELIVIEGYQEIDIAVRAKMELTELFYSVDYAKDKRLPIAESLTVNFLSKEAFDKISVRGNPDGFLVLAKPRYFTLDEIKLSKNPLVIVIEAVEKPGNLGAIVRSAAARVLTGTK